MTCSGSVWTELQLKARTPDLRCHPPSPRPADRCVHCFRLARATWALIESEAPEHPFPQVACKAEDRFPWDWGYVISQLAVSPKVFLVHVKKCPQDRTIVPPLQTKLCPRAGLSLRESWAQILHMLCGLGQVTFLLCFSLSVKWQESLDLGLVLRDPRGSTYITQSMVDAQWVTLTSVTVRQCCLLERFGQNKFNKYLLFAICQTPWIWKTNETCSRNSRCVRRHAHRHSHLTTWRQALLPSIWELWRKHWAPGMRAQWLGMLTSDSTSAR